jgi:hypothetical protein
VGVPAKRAAVKRPTKQAARAKSSARAATSAARKAPQSAGKKTTAKGAATSKPAGAARKPGDPRPDKAEGDAPVKSYIASLPDWQRGIAERVDAIVERELPDARRAVKWGSAMYGVAGQGWILSMKGFRKHVKLVFFNGVALDPNPPSGDGQMMRALDVGEADPLDEDQVADWVRQAAMVQGWGKV